ncbi:MAG: hypothetical protein RO469_07850 [Thermincola sp.]|jgi:hypothetical protein|nr:hypothetical protein [Thermincola sp.]
MFWGKIAVLTGIIALLVVSKFKGNPRLRNFILIIDLLAIFLLQLPPLFLWLLFNGTTIGDGPEGPLGHWLWSAPHIFVAWAATYSLYHLLFRETTLMSQVCYIFIL